MRATTVVGGESLLVFVLSTTDERLVCNKGSAAVSRLSAVTFFVASILELFYAKPLPSRSTLCCTQLTFSRVSVPEQLMRATY